MTNERDERSSRLDRADGKRIGRVQTVEERKSLGRAIVEIAGAAKVADRIRAVSYQRTQALAAAVACWWMLGAFRVRSQCFAAGQTPLDQSLLGGNEGGWYFRVGEGKAPITTASGWLL